jgi:protein involved in polysaccharide export with SLBB domain
MGALRSSLILGTLIMLLTGCDASPWNDFLDPAEPKIVDPGQKPLVLPILDTLASGIEGPDAYFPDATDVEPGDLIPEISDYKIGPNDLVSISVFDLLGAGTGEQVKVVRVTETGSISLPFIPPVKAEGLTEHELEGAVSKAYADARLIRDARVSVAVQEEHARSFSIQGNIGLPGEYQISKPNFRMLDALVASNGPYNSNGIHYAYVIRKAAEPAAAVEPTEPNNGNAPVSPSSQPSVPASGPADLLSPPPPTAPTGPQGRALPDESPDRPMVMDNLAAQDSSQPFKFDDVEKPTDQRIIRVPIDQLEKGELKFNVVIRPGDMIIVPNPVTGVYYVGGHVARPGVFILSSGEKVTLKKAWIAAGGEDIFSFPNRAEVVRRIGPNREVCARVDMAKVMAMEQPDIFLKPNDVVYVGTHFIAPFLAAVRTSFSASFETDFIYDRDFSPITNSNNSIPGQSGSLPGGL